MTDSEIPVSERLETALKMYGADVIFADGDSSQLEFMDISRLKVAAAALRLKEAGFLGKTGIVRAQRGPICDWVGEH